MLKKLKCHLKLSAKNMQCNGQPFKCHVFCIVHWALNSGAEVLNQRLIPNLEPHSVCVNDNASFHNIQMDRAPTSNLDKEVMLNLLYVRNIRFCDTVLKVQFYEIIKTLQV